MIISIASGKGGTGKTTVSTNLAFALAENMEVQYLDCDVEEPNGHLFLKPEFAKKEKVNLLIPQIDRDKCTYCGICSDVCMFNALAVIEGDVLVFDDLCHSCGACWYFCPEKAISTTPKMIGLVESGRAGNVEFVHGRLNVGVAISPPVINQVKKHIDPGKVAVLDVPPGTSCPVIESVEGSDFCILVTEPTPFGLNDLKLAVEMLRKLAIPFGVVINRSDIGDNRVDDYCASEEIPVLLRIPHSRDIATVYSKGGIVVRELPEYRELFIDLFNKVKGLIKK